MKNIAASITNVLASRWFYRAVLVFFILEALWIALSAFYPMAFDEEFHFGIIKFYAEQWSPFLSADVGSSGQFGAVARDPSYLFHWLMSFPYRFITLFTDSQTAAIIFLRLINIGLFTTGMLLFYRLLKTVGMSPAFRNTALLLFVLIPVVPLLAGQINYDNLLMIFVAGACLLVVSLHRSLAKHQVDLRAMGLLLLVCMFGSLVKYAFVPIAVAAILYVVVVAFWFFKKRGAESRRALASSYRALGRFTKIGLLTALVIGLVLCLQRYGLNIVQYHTPLPDCAAVLSVDQCKKYGPWERNYRFAGDKGKVDPNPLRYVDDWVKGMHKRLFFMINGPHHHYYQNYPPPPIIANTATTIAVVSVIALLVFGRKVLRRNPVLLVLVVLPALYIAALWFNNYAGFIQTGRPVAINGRYLIPVLLPLAAVAGTALHYAFRRLPSLKPYVAVVAILLFLQGGGVFSFILRSDDTWYWESRPVVNMNHAAKNVLDPVIYEGSYKIEP